MAVAQLERGGHLEGPADAQQLVVGDLQRLAVDHDRAPTVGARRAGALDGPRRRRLGQGVAEAPELVARDEGVDDVPPQVAFERGADVGPRCRQVEVGRAVGRLVERRHGTDPPDPERADAVGVPRHRHEVPGAALEDEAERADPAPHGATRPPVLDVDAPPVPQRARQRGERRHGLRGAEPAGHVDEEALAEPRRAGPQLGRQGGVDLRLRRHEHVPEAELGGSRRDAGQPERGRLATREPGQARLVATDELDPTARPALAVDRHARRAERLDVAVDRAHRDLEVRRQLARRRAAAPLQQQQQLDEPAGAHAARVGRITDRRCQG